MNHLTGLHKNTWKELFTKFKQDRLGKQRAESSSNGATMDGFMQLDWLDWLVDSKMFSHSNLTKTLNLSTDF